MLWTRFEWECWTLGVEFEGFAYTAHVGPLKVSYVKKSSQFYHDLKSTR